MRFPLIATGLLMSSLSGSVHASTTSVVITRTAEEPLKESDIDRIIASYNYLVDSTGLMSVTDIYLLDMYIVLCEISVEPSSGDYVDDAECVKIPDPLSASSSSGGSAGIDPKLTKAKEHLKALLETNASGGGSSA